MKKRKFFRSERGVAAIEAAIVLPVMVFFAMGVVELYQYFRANAIMTRAAFSVADGLSMQQELYDGGPCDLTDHVCTYGALMPDLMRPVAYQEGGRLRIRLIATETQTTGSGGNRQTKTVWKSTPEWGKSCDGSGACQDFIQKYEGNEIPAPAQNDTVVVVEVYQTYEPFIISSNFWQSLGGPRTLRAASFYRPRFDDLKALQ